MTSENIVNISSSALAGLMARLVCHPIDTCKAKLQSGDTFTGLNDLVRKTFRNEGVRGFYQGIGAALMGGVPGVCVYISTYEASKRNLEKYDWIRKNQFSSYFISGMAAEAVCCAIFVPVDVVKERLQVQSNRGDSMYKGSIDAFRTIIKQEGLRGLYKGYNATIFSYGPFSAIYFVLYEEAKKAVAARNNHGANDKLPFTQNLACSAVAGSVASFLTTPLDVAKLRFQIQRNIKVGGSQAASPAGEEAFTGLWDALGKLHGRYGVRGLFRGALTRVCFFTPSTAITMASYDYFKVFLAQRLQ